MPIAAGGVLALLAIGSAAVAVNRRRNEDDEEWLSDDESTEPAPVAHEVAESHGEVDEHDEPAILAPPVSAFQWKAEQSSAEGVEPLAGTDDRNPGETWVERAYRGASALNPSASLKTRLKRAAFFDKRERDASAGLAEPVDPSAGLPERMIDENQLGQQSEFA